MADQTTGTPMPTSITVHQASRVLEISFSSGEHFKIPLELMRVYSPSAEVTGHGPGQEVLQTGKREVTVSAIEPMGNYAIRLLRWARQRPVHLELPLQARARAGCPLGHLPAAPRRGGCQPRYAHDPQGRHGVEKERALMAAGVDSTK